MYDLVNAFRNVHTAFKEDILVNRVLDCFKGRPKTFKNSSSCSDCIMVVLTYRRSKLIKT